MKLRKRLMLWYASLLTLIIILLAVGTIVIIHITMMTSMDNALEETINLVEENSRLVSIPVLGAATQVEVELPELNFFRVSGIEIQIWKQEAGRFNLEDATANLRTYQHALDPSSLGSTETHVFNSVNIDDTLWRVRTSPIFNTQGQFIGNIQVAGSLEMINKIVSQFLVFMMVSCTVIIAAAMLLSMRLARWVVKPVEDITEAAMLISGTDDLSTRIAWNGTHDELGQLTTAFNQMMQRIEDSFLVQQKLISDISHELRTPLTAMCGNLEMMKRYKEGHEEAIKSIEEDAYRMKSLVNDLLHLARVDDGRETVEISMTVELDSVLSDAFNYVRGNLGDRQLSLKLTHIEPLKILGSDQSIKQAFTAIIDNAVKFTPDGGTVNVSLRRCLQNALIEVEDTGIGISPKEKTLIFNRFYQVDTSRTHNGKSFGLGLSKAQWVVNAHGGKIEVQSQLNMGTKVSIELPMYDPMGSSSEDDDEDPTESSHQPSYYKVIRETRIMKRIE